MNITASYHAPPAQIRSCGTCGGPEPAAEAAPAEPGALAPRDPSRADQVQLSGAPAPSSSAGAAATGLVTGMQAALAAVPPPGSHAGVHGMLVFGTNLMSHIPMFHVPHDYTIIMDVQLKHPDLPEGQNYGGQLHTFVPEKFSLGDLLNGRLTSFQGSLFEGNFEDSQHSKQLLEGVTAEVRQILRAEHLDEHSKGPAELEYVVYGTPQDAYLTHPIHGDADFDQLLGVRVEAGSLKAEDLARGIRVTVPDHANRVEDRLQPQRETVEVRTPDGNPVSLKVERELSILIGPGFMQGPGHGGGGHQH